MLILIGAWQQWLNFWFEEKELYMKDFMTDTNLKYYYLSTFFIIVAIALGLFVLNPRVCNLEIGFLLHLLFAILQSVCLLLYPKFRTSSIRLIFVIVSALFFYLLFFLYPETGSTIILLCFIPAISILFFDAKLFYFSIILNSFLATITFSIVKLSDNGDLYSYIGHDLIGNIINFLGSQLVLFLIFYATSERIKRLQLYYESMKHSERLKTTGLLAAAVAHEIRNPLTVVKGYLQLYEQNNAIDDKGKKNFSIMIKELDSAEQVISQLLSLSKPSKENTTEKLDVKLVIHSVTDLLQSYGLSHRNYIEVFAEEDCYIEINKIEFNQLLVNIIKNAIEASACGDSITVTAGKKEGFVEITITDKGQGMSAEELELLGTPFYSLKSKGTGLGIMICNNIVSNYNGEMTFNSSKGKGTTVTIYF
ncbi:ATP-binding protein, partial [Lysinibacillus telephonicus]